MGVLRRGPFATIAWEHALRSGNPECGECAAALTKGHP